MVEEKFDLEFDNDDLFYILIWIKLEYFIINTILYDIYKINGVF